MLHLAERACVIVGGGAVGSRKATGLLSTGAKITVISSALDPVLENLAEEGKITILRQLYLPGMLGELQPFLVFAATNDAVVNCQIADEAHSLGALVDVADSSAENDFAGMATTRRGSITVAFSTGGVSPALATHLRVRVEQVIGEEYATLARWLAESRPQVQATASAQPERAVFWHHLLESSVLEDLHRGDESAARVLFDQLLQQAVGDQA